MRSASVVGFQHSPRIMGTAAEFEDWLPEDAREVSMLQPHGSHQSKCGYCKGESGFASFGMSSRRLTCMDYQALIDSNWRRSGTYLYRPSLEESCCPLYTIRLDVGEFRATKQQNQLLRKMQRFLDGEIDLLSDAPVAPHPARTRRSSQAVAPELAAIAKRLHAALTSAAEAACASGSLPSALSLELPPASAADPHPLVTVNAAGLRSGSSRPVFASAAAMRLGAAARKSGAAVTPAAVAAALAAAWPLDATRAALAGLSVPAAGAPFLNFSLVDADATSAVEAAATAAAEAPPGPGAASTGGSAAPPTPRAAASSSTSSSSPGLRKHCMRVECVPARFDEDAFALYRRYQVAVHGDKEDEVTPDQYRGFLVDSPLLPAATAGPSDEELSRADELKAAAVALGVGEELVALAAAAMGGMEGARSAIARLVPDMGVAALSEALAQEREALVAARVAVSRAAQARAWRDGERGAPSPAAAAAASGSEAPAGGFPGFGRGAVAHGLGEAPAQGGTGMSQGFGSFHHKYFLDERLVAVAVVDVLPHCLVSPGSARGSAPHARPPTPPRDTALRPRLPTNAPSPQSSVYVFYDPDLPRLQLGRYTALREIQWVQAAARHCPRLRHYYMGYYVHSCQKMRYKADYRPSRLLCPVTGSWVAAETAQRVLNTKRYARLDGTSTDLAGASAETPAAAGRAAAATCAERLAEARAEMRKAPEQEEADAAAAAEAMPLVLVRSRAACRVSGLTSSGQEAIRPLLQQFAQHCTHEVASRTLGYF